MKNKYLVKITISDRTNLADILDSIGDRADTLEIEVIANVPAPKPLKDNVAPKVASAPKAKGERKRKSKVNQALLSRLNEGEATISELKEALETAGMSAASLSTGIAALTKSQEIERVGDGLYNLSSRSRAAA